MHGQQDITFILIGTDMLISYFSEHVYLYWGLLHVYRFSFHAKWRRADIRCLWRIHV